MNPVKLIPTATGKGPCTRPTRVRYGVLGFACVLSMITYLDRVCFGTVAPFIQSEFGLTDRELGYLFGAFVLAYSVFEVPSGWLGDLFGPRRTLIRIVIWWSIFTAITGCIWPFRLTIMGPIAITGFALMAIVRFLFGAGEAGAYPNISRAFHNWFPFTERGRAQGAVWMAGRFGGGITPLVVLALIYYSPLVVHENSAEQVAAAVGAAAIPGGFWGTIEILLRRVAHWRHIFWILGGLGLAWCVAFRLWFRDRPEQHPAVNQAELDLIRGTALDAPEAATPACKHDAPDANGITHPPGVMVPAERVPNLLPAPDHSNVPWRRLLTSPNLWALCLMYFCGSFGWYFNITWLPKYLKEHYHVSAESHGFWTMSLLAGLPLLLGSLACLIGGLLTDWFIHRTGDRKWGRRLFGVVGHGTCAVCYFLSLKAGSPYAFVLFVALASFWNDLTMGSAWASCLDIGGRYSGIVSGCMNTIGNLGGFVAALTTGAVLDHYKQDGWQINFISYGAVYIVAVCLWLRFDATKPVAEE